MNQCKISARIGQAGPGYPVDEIVRVWDRGVRAFHWALVAAVLASALTGFVLGHTALAWHLVAGVDVMAAIAWRVVWGLLGPAYASFASFAYRPATVLASLGGFRGVRHRRHLGHNPLGAMMVFALLAALTAIGVIGAIARGDVTLTRSWSGSRPTRLPPGVNATSPRSCRQA